MGIVDKMRRHLLIGCAVLLIANGAPTQSQDDNSGIQTIKIFITIPDSTNVVETSIPVDSSIPECLRKDTNTAINANDITVMADVFTECAKGELRRIQREFDENPPPSSLASSGPKGKAEKTADSPKEETLDSPENDDGVQQQKDAAEAIVNATADAVSTASNPGDVAAVLQTVFDYRRVMNDLRRILKGDIFGVIGEYPERVNGLFKLVQELPKRIVKSIGIVNKLRSSTNDTTFKGVLTNLKDYLTQASKTAKNLPNAFTLVSVMDTLRNVAARIAGEVHEGRVEAEAPKQRALLHQVDEILKRQLGDIFGLDGPEDPEFGGQQRSSLGRRFLDFRNDRFVPSDILERALFLRRREYPQYAQVPGGK